MPRIGYVYWRFVCADAGFVELERGEGFGWTHITVASADVRLVAKLQTDGASDEPSALTGTTFQVDPKFARGAHAAWRDLLAAATAARDAGRI
jgi:hypothetical protein